MNVPEDIKRTAMVAWKGDIAKGRGSITTESGKINAEYSFGTRFSGDPGTNPEELLGASHAACFTMALTAQLSRAGHPPATIDTTAKVHLHREGSAISIAAIELTTTAAVAGVGEDEFQKLAGEAKVNCPISLALKAVPIHLVATLKPA